MSDIIIYFFTKSYEKLEKESTWNLFRCGNNSQIPITAISSMGKTDFNPCFAIIDLKIDTGVNEYICMYVCMYVYK